MYTLSELAKHLNAELVGDGQCEIHAVAALTDAGQGDISFIANKRYRKFLDVTKASAVILRPCDQKWLQTNALIVEDPYLCYTKVATLLYPRPSAQQGIHPSAVVHPAVELPKSVSIGPNCVIEEGVKLAEGVVIGASCVLQKDVTIGGNSELLSSVTICHGTHIGQRCLIHPGAVIGSDGFGLVDDHGTWVKIPQVGIVELHDDVEVGANTTIDRGAIGNTIIETGVKLDNLIHIAHNVRIGAHTAIAAGTAIAGSTTLGAHCTIAGKVGIVGHLEIVDNVTITAMSLVVHSIRQPGVYSAGVPMQPNAQWHKNYVRFKQLDEMARRIKRLEQRLSEDKK